MAAVADGDELEQHLGADPVVAQVMDLGCSPLATALARAARATEDELAPAAPLGRFEVGVVGAPPSLLLGRAIGLAALPVASVLRVPAIGFEAAQAALARDLVEPTVHELAGDRLAGLAAAGLAHVEEHVDLAGTTCMRSCAPGASGATLALEAGIHPKIVQERLGHSTIAITLDTYSHAIPAMQEDAAAKIAALLDG